MADNTDNDSAKSSIGLYLCRCNGEISKYIDLDRIADNLKSIENVKVVGIHDALCSREGQTFLKEEKEKHGFERAVIGACSPNIQGIIVGKALEEKGLNKYLFEQVNIREQCAWVHPDIDKATAKALALINGGLRRVLTLEPMEDVEISILPSALVIGGGVTGMQAALDIAAAGFKVYLLERTEELGGRAYKLSMTFPTHNCGICCMQYCKECVFTPKIEDVLQDEKIEVMLNSEIESIEGGFGNRHITVKAPDGPREFDVGTIIVATGSKTFDPSDLPELNYSSPDVITTVELEQLIVKQREKGGSIERPSDGKVPKTINFIQCVGSRDRAKGNLHCSLVCCTYAIGQARELVKLIPDATVYIHYIDLRGPYRGFEEFYDAAKQEGVQFVRGRISKIYSTGGKLFVRAEDTDAGALLEIESDLVVLSVGQEPAQGSEKIVEMLHLQTDIDEFIKDINPMFPPEFRRGIYAAGCAQGPKGIRYSIDDAKSAASEVIRLMRDGTVKMPRITAKADEFRCRGCGRCVDVCQFDAITLIEDGKGGQIAKVDEVRCEGCGTCTVACCNKAMTIIGYAIPQVIANVMGLVEEAGQ
ncbi:MAG TPA: CoB--CoM heterodisulfide reductase iron-sulfur subunit A family protein [Euryarchaeota archaeon]|nr:CoB--CoM heterodisulfide reductase iron-sulfur subunit A family protein [Euryarchaeota archaeon]